MSASSKRILLVGAAGLLAAACTDVTSTAGSTLELSPAFQTIPVGFSANSNSFDASGDAGLPFMPGAMSPAIGYHGDGEKNRGRGNDGFGPGGIRGLLMGGGLGPDFIGGIPFGRGKGRGPFGRFELPESCTFSATTGRVTCPETTRHGLTVNVSYAFKNSAGTAQPAFDTATTNSVNVKTEVSGTKTRHEGAITSTVAHSSDRTISGLAPGNTERTVNGTAKADETTTGTKDDVEFTAKREAADTTRNVVVPVVENGPTIPKAGTVIRVMKVSITPEGGTATTRTRREEITFNGTNTVPVKITVDGETKNCTITLPRRKLECEED